MTPATKSKPAIDSQSQRCVGCGHPRKEHSGRKQCTVPRCECREYQLPEQG